MYNNQNQGQPVNPLGQGGQNNVYQAQLQQGQMQKLQNQYNQQNVQKIQEQTELKQVHIKQLASKFQVNPAHPTDLMIGGPEREELIVAITQNVFARMVIYNNYPEAKPRFFLSNKFRHQFIDDSTWEVIYLTFYKWNERSSNLLELVQAISNRFTQVPPEKDALLHEINRIKNICYEEGQYENLLQCNLGQIFPNHQPEQWAQLLNYQSLDQLIIQTKEYKTLVDFLLQLMTGTEIYSQQMIQQYSEILNKREHVQQLASLCDIKKAELLKQFQQCQMIKERFDKTKVLQQLEQEINVIEEQQQQNDQYDIVDYDEDENQKAQKFTQNLQKFYQERKKYHEYKLKKQKLEEIL